MSGVIYLSLSDFDFLEKWNKYKYQPNIQVDWVSSHKLLLNKRPLSIGIFPHNPILPVFIQGEFVDLTPEEAFHLSMGNPNLKVMIPFIKGTQEYNTSKLKSLKLRIELR